MQRIYLCHATNKNFPIYAEICLTVLGTSNEVSVIQQNVNEHCPPRTKIKAQE